MTGTEIIQQRNRFMAFSFASADLLLEVQNDGNIGFALGAATPFTKSEASDLVGRQVADLVAVKDAKLMQHLIASISAGQRFGPMTVRSAGDTARDVMVSGCRFPGYEEVLCLTFSIEARSGPATVVAERDSHTGLIEAGDFEGVAKEALQSARKGSQDIKLSLFSFEGQEDFASRVDGDVAEEFLAQTGAILRSAAFADAAGRQGDGKYAILHANDVEVNTITDRLRQASIELDPKREGIRIEGGSIEIEPEMSAKDAAAALVFAVNQFASDDNGLLRAEGLTTSVETLMKETGARMSRFREAITQGKLSFLKQPIVDLQSKQTHHYEVLVRFEENKSPYEMIRFAEGTGLIMELDDIILKQAISYLSGSEADSNTSLAINVSGRSLSSPTFTSNLFRAMSGVTFARSKLMLEITESAIIEDLTQANQIIQKVRKLGHMVCLDDFGAGAASFQYLRALTVDFIKIDGAYVRTALKRGREATLLKGIASLARDLDTRTIAESIETKEQSAMLLDLGIDQGQGYLFGRPAPLNFSRQDGYAA